MENVEEKHSKAVEYTIKEFEVLRIEIDSTLKDIRAFELYGIIATGTIWAWLATHSNDNLFAWSLPLLLSFAGFFRNWGLYRHLGFIGKYIKQIEIVHLKGYALEGWEHWLDKDRGVRRVVTDNLVWIILLFVALPAIYLRSDFIVPIQDHTNPITIDVKPFPCPPPQSKIIKNSPHSVTPTNNK